MFRWSQMSKVSDLGHICLQCEHSLNERVASVFKLIKCIKKIYCYCLLMLEVVGLFANHNSQQILLLFQFATGVISEQPVLVEPRPKWTTDIFHIFKDFLLYMDSYNCYFTTIYTTRFMLHSYLAVHLHACAEAQCSTSGCSVP